MEMRRSLAMLFASGATAFALFAWAGVSSPRPLLAGSAGCGGYLGPLCTKTRACIYFLGLGEVCTEIYTYYPAPGDTTGTKPVAPEVQ